MQPFLFALALAALHPELRTAREVSDFYVCEMKRRVPGCQLTILASGPADGSETYFRAAWSGPNGGRGPILSLHWRGLTAPPADADAFIFFWVPRRLGYARAELRRRYGREVLLSGHRMGADSVIPSGWGYSTRLDWGEVVRLVRGPDPIVAVLAPEAGPPRMSGRVSRAMIEAPADAMAAVRAEVERIAAARSCGRAGSERLRL